MAYEIFELKKEGMTKVDEIKSDDLIGRQSIWLRDEKSLGLDGDNMFLKIEGDEKAVKKAEELLGETATMISGGKKEEINKRFIADDEKSSEGMGFIFG